MEGERENTKESTGKEEKKLMFWDVSDVTHLKRGLRFEKKQRVLVGLRADDVKAVSIERLCLSLLMWNYL